MILQCQSIEHNSLSDTKRFKIYKSWCGAKINISKVDFAFCPKNAKIVPGFAFSISCAGKQTTYAWVQAYKATHYVANVEKKTLFAFLGPGMCSLKSLDFKTWWYIRFLNYELTRAYQEETESDPITEH